MSGATLIATGRDSAEHGLAGAGAVNANATVLMGPVGTISDRADLEDSKQDKNAGGTAYNKVPVRGHPSAMYQKSHANPVGGLLRPQPVSNSPGTLAASSEASGKVASADGLKTASASQADKLLALNSVERERMASVEQIIQQAGWQSGSGQWGDRHVLYPIREVEKPSISSSGHQQR